MGCDGSGVLKEFVEYHGAGGWTPPSAAKPIERPCPGCPACKPWDFEKPEHGETSQEAWERARLDEEDV
jgi:hypothetical protein